MSTAKDLIFFANLLRELEKDLTPADHINEITPLILGDGFLHPPFRVIDGKKWQTLGLLRAVHFVRQIVSRYVQLFQDPRELPVTHSLRQKKVAIHLDQQFKIILRELVIRSGNPLEENGSPHRDEFLDEPILYLKQEARTKRFPKTKNRGVKLADLLERFDEKLAVKGANLVKLEQQDSFLY